MAAQLIGQQAIKLLAFQGRLKEHFWKSSMPVKDKS